MVMPSGDYGASRRQNPAIDKIFGEIQNRYPFHLGLNLEFRSLSLSLLTNRLNILTRIVKTIRKTRKVNYPAQLIANLLVNLKEAKWLLFEISKSPAMKILNILKMSNLL